MAEDINISPEMINNIMNMLKNSNTGDNTSEKATETEKSDNSNNLGDILSRICF